jgi:hypothetical protein
MPARRTIPEDTQQRVLDRSRRRCALCTHFDNNFDQTGGQIAHIDRDPSNVDEENLVYLFLRHHDDYDTQRRQTKNLTEREVKTARNRLYDFIEGGGDFTIGPRPSTATGLCEAVNDVQPLAILIGNGLGFDRFEPAGVSMRRTVSIKVKNKGRRRISDCRLQIFRITPAPAWRGGPWALGPSNFNLEPQEYLSVDLAAYDEIMPEGRKGRDILVCLPAVGGFYTGMLFTLPTQLPSALALKVTSPNTRECEAHCRLSIDGAGQLRIEALS